MLLYRLTRAYGLAGALKIASTRGHPAMDRNAAASDVRWFARRAWIQSLTREQFFCIFTGPTLWSPKEHRCRYGEDWLTDREAHDFLDSQSQERGP